MVRKWSDWGNERLASEEAPAQASDPEYQFPPLGVCDSAGLTTVTEGGTYKQNPRGVSRAWKNSRGIRLF